MKFQKFLILLIYSLAVPTFTIAQSFSIQSRLLDQVTAEPLPYASIYNASTQNGTVSNLEGYFTLQKVQVGDTLTISYIGYETTEIIVSNEAFPTTIYLTSKLESLNEIVVLGENTLLYILLNRCKKNLSYKEQTAKTYFSLETFAKGKQVELVESYYNGIYAGYDTESLELKNGRIALSDINGRFFTSTETSKAFYLYELFSANAYFPSSPFELSKKKLRSIYQLQLISRYEDENRHPIYVIGYSPKVDSGQSFQGEVWIDSLEAQVIKVNLQIENAQVHPFYAIGKDSLLQVDIDITKTFGRDEKKIRTSAIDFNYQLEYQTTEGISYDVSTNAFLHAYNYDKAFVLPYFEYTDGNYLDYLKINATPYNEYFWENIDEFNMGDVRDKNDFFLSTKAKLDNRTIFSNNDYFKKGLLEHPYIFWNESRIHFENRAIENEEDRYPDDFISDDYNFNVKLFMDVNELNDSIHVVTKTIFDPFETYSDLIQDSVSSAFVNMYFDLVEIQRRALVKEISQVDKSFETIHSLYEKRQEKINKELEKFVDQTRRGYDKLAMIKWNTHIKDSIGIDNLRTFNLYIK